MKNAEKEFAWKKPKPKITLEPAFANLDELLEAGKNSDFPDLSHTTSLEVAHKKSVYPYPTKRERGSTVSGTFLQHSTIQIRIRK